MGSMQDICVPRLLDGAQTPAGKPEGKMMTAKALALGINRRSLSIRKAKVQPPQQNKNDQIEEKVLAFLKKYWYNRTYQGY